MAVRPVEERVWEKIDKRSDDECWPYMGIRHDRGYGRIWDGTYTKSGGRRLARAHRIVYEMCVGKIPAGQEVCHLCDNPSCCNPKHLFAATHRENMIHASQNRRWSEKLKGERNPAAKLTAVQVADIRESYTGKRGELAALARKYDVVPSTISFVLRGQHWR